MRDSINRLQFRHNDKVFDSNIEAIRAFVEWNSTTEANPSVESLSLLGEPTILRYKNESNPNDPHIILAIGSNTNEVTGPYAERLNGYCFIDAHDIRKKIHDHYDEFKKAIAKVNIEAVDSDSLDLYASTSDSGTVISGDVKIAKYHTFDGMDGRLAYNSLFSIASGDTADKNGLFAYVNVDFDERKNEIIFQISNWDGTLKTKRVGLPTKYVKGGEYKIEDESLYLYYNDESDPLVIDLSYLVREWKADNGTNTPVCLKKVEGVASGDLTNYQDVLVGDIRLKDETLDANGNWVRMEGSTNILNRTFDKRALYVDGVASNIVYYDNGVKSNVENKLNELSKLKISSDSNNIITEKIDGFFASSKLEYVSSENTLVFKVSSRNDSGQTYEKATEIKLNTVDFFKNIWYDSLKEELVIEWVDDEGKTRYTRIPVGQMIEEWEPQNEGHNVTIVRARHISGKDKVSADAKIASTQPNNILQDINHELYVNGIASNIKYDITGSTNVKQKIDELREDLTNETNRAISAETDLRDDLNDEIARAQGVENTLRTDLDAEILRATTVDQQLRDDLTAETNRAISAETAETNRAISAETDLRDDLNDEIARAQGVENTLRTDLTAETTRAQGVENTLRTDLNAEILRATTVDQQLRDDLTAETNRAISAETAETNRAEAEEERLARLSVAAPSVALEYDTRDEILRMTYESVDGTAYTASVDLGLVIEEWEPEPCTSLDSVCLTRERVYGGKDLLKADVKIASGYSDNILVNSNGFLYVSNSGIVTNATAIADETARAINEETILSDKIGTGFTPGNNVTDKFNDLSTNLTNEINRATLAEHALEDKLGVEKTDRISGDTALQYALDTEVTRAMAAESILDTDLDNEIARASGVEATLTSSLNTEITRAQGVENTLRTDLTAETTRAQGVENTLRTDLTAETTRATATEAALQNALNVETTRATTAENGLQTAINTTNTNLSNEVTRATTVENNLRDAISAITLSFNDTDTIDFVGTSTITANVKVPTTDNIILIDQGIKANVDLSYDSGRNELTFTKSSQSGDVVRTITLNAGSIIDGIHYDDTTKKLIITYHTSSSAIPQDVEVDVSHLFNEWVCDSNHLGAVVLNKSLGTGPDGADVLSAAIQVSSLPNNMLVNDNGVLIVDGTPISANAASIAALRTDLDAEILRATTVDQQLRDDLTAEITRASSAETALNVRALSAETALQTSIDNEVTRATYAESTLTTALQNEITRATNAETLLQDEITAIEQSTSSSSTAIEAALAAETATRANADTALQNAINSINTALNGSLVTITRNGVTTGVYSPTAGTQSINIAVPTSLSDLTGSTIGSLTVNTTQGSSTSTMIYNPSTGDQTLTLNIPDSMTHTLTIQTGATSVGTYDGSANVTINVPENLSHLTNWNSSTSTLTVPGDLVVTGSITATSAVYSSDANLKENIGKANFDKEIAANGVLIKQYNFRNDPSKSTMYGIIAQDLEEAGLGEIVVTKEDGFKAVDYTSLMMLKIGYLEEQNRYLTRELDMLKNRLSKLENND